LIILNGKYVTKGLSGTASSGLNWNW
jgi:hypothetical protein